MTTNFLIKNPTLTFLILVISSFNFVNAQCAGQSFPGERPDCMPAIKTGRFTYEGLEGKVEIIRTETEQTEIYNNGKSRLVMDIEWISDTEYVLTHKKSINTTPGCLEEGDRITTKIISCEGAKFYSIYVSNRCGEGTNTFVKLSNNNDSQHTLVKNFN